MDLRSVRNKTEEDRSKVGVQAFSEAFFLAHLPDFIERVMERPARARPLLEDSELSIQEFKREARALVGALVKDIRQGRYHPQPARLRIVEADKARVIVKFSLIDEFVLSALGSWVQGELEGILEDSVYGFRKGRSDRTALRRASKYIVGDQPTRTWQGALWVVRRDVSSFGESLSHERVFRLAREYLGQNPVGVDLIERFARFPILSESSNNAGDLSYNFRGLPTGSNLQLQLSNLYLHDLDSELGAIPNAVYTRLGDDILFMTRERAVAETVSARVNAFIATAQLTLNLRKSMDFCLTKPHLALPSSDPWPTRAVFRFLGMDLFWDGRTRLPADKWQVLLETIRKVFFSTQVLAEPEERFRASVGSLRALLEQQELNPRFQAYFRKITTIEQLRELDRWISLMIGKAHFFPRFAKKNLRRTSPGKLRRLGIPSCVHVARVRGIIN
jgi:hypothetical protein